MVILTAFKFIGNPILKKDNGLQYHEANRIALRTIDRTWLTFFLIFPYLIINYANSCFEEGG